jgi:hypothetical protein
MPASAVDSVNHPSSLTPKQRLELLHEYNVADYNRYATLSICTAVLCFPMAAVVLHRCYPLRRNVRVEIC